MMGRIVVCYESEYGNAQRVAETIAEELRRWGGIGGTEWETAILRRAIEPPEYRFRLHGAVVDREGPIP